MVTDMLYSGIQPLLEQRNIETVTLKLEKPMKGFDGKEWNPPFYLLKISQKEHETKDLLTERLDKLEHEVQWIPVFGNSYDKVSMEKNFIKLAMVCRHETEGHHSRDTTERDKRDAWDLVSQIYGKTMRRRTGNHVYGYTV